MQQAFSGPAAAKRILTSTATVASTPALLLVLVALSTSLITAPAASAHPYIEETMPGRAQNAPVGTSEVVVFFSESVDIEFSEIKVIDDGGNRIDNKDLRYHQYDTALAVSTPPLQDGIYTVSTKVLSKVDGHLVPGIFLFGVGDVEIDSELHAQQTELLFLPEAGAEFPGMVGQTIIVGAAVSALAVWRGQDRRSAKDEMAILERAHHKRFMQITGAGLLLVLASDLLVIMMQMARLESGFAEAVQTQFGMIWLARMAITVALFGMWFAAYRRGQDDAKIGMPSALMLAAALGLMMTSSISGHGAATNTAEAVVLDYIHNVVAGVWIGGIIYIAFVLMPTLSRCPEACRERLSLAAIPRFSMIFIISVGVVIVTGPTLLWTLESDVGLITESLFGRLIMLKVAIASAMVGMGGFVQYRIQRQAESEITTGRSRKGVHPRLSRTLRVDAALGIALLAVVALLTNGTLPAGEVRSVDAEEALPGFSVMEFSDNARFDIAITPFGTGENLIVVSAVSTNGTALGDLDRIKAKASNPERGIPPLEIEMDAVPGDDSTATYQGRMTLAFSGQWLLEVEALRTQSANEAVRLDVFARPRLADMNVTVTEYPLSNETRPLHAAYDRAESVWFTDASAPRLWEVDTETGKATPHEFEGAGSSFLTYSSHDGNIWFVDSGGGQIGFVDVRTDRITTIKTPEFESPRPSPDPGYEEEEEAIPFYITTDAAGDVWFTVINKGLIARYQPESGAFEEIAVPGRDARPFALAEGPGGMIWYTDTGAGTVGYVDPGSGNLTEVIGQDAALQSPEALLFEGDVEGGGLWITEHTGFSVTRFDPVLETLKRHMVDDPDSLPFGMALDRYGNIWFAQHTIDRIGVLDSRNGEIMEIEIPTETSFIQFLEQDDSGNIWFAEQRAGKVGVLRITEKPPADYRAPGPDGIGLDDVRYADIVSPLMALGVLATSLFYAKAVHDKRRLDRLLRPALDKQPL